MRYVSLVASGVLLGATMFSSCTCHKEVSLPPTLEEAARPGGFHASGPKITPQTKAEAPTVPPVPTRARFGESGPTPTPPADVPANFPKDVPIFKDAELSRVQDLANDAHNVIFNTAAPVGDVFSFYQNKMTSAGWKVSEQFQRPGHAFLKFEKGNQVANVTIAEDVSNPGKKVIAIMYEEQQPLPFDEF